MNRIELERQHLKKYELSSQTSEDELYRAYAVIYGVQARGEKGFDFLNLAVKISLTSGNHRLSVVEAV